MSYDAGHPCCAEYGQMKREIERLRFLGRAIIEANDEFRASLPPDWEGDPVNDACEAARDSFTAG